MEVKWIKICTDIFDDEKILLIETMPDCYEIITVWFKLLCLAGKNNNNGVFLMNSRIAYTDKMLATIFRMKESTVQLALSTFEKFGMIELVDGVITIPNWAKHQSLDRLEKYNSYHKDYMREQRAKQKMLCEVNSDVNSGINSDVNVNPIEEAKKKIRIDKNKSVSSKENTMQIFKRLIVDYQIPDDVIEKLELWFKYKSERKEPYKEQGMKSFLTQIENNVNKYGNRAICNLIDECMASGWKGIIFDRLEKSSYTQKERLSWVDDI